jgi:hypothetical protein
MAGNIDMKLSALAFRGMDTMGHRGAFDVGSMTATTRDFGGFDKTRQIVLVTFKRSGEAMPSPINHGVADGKFYVRTDAGLRGKSIGERQCSVWHAADGLYRDHSR